MNPDDGLKGTDLVHGYEAHGPDGGLRATDLVRGYEAYGPDHEPADSPQTQIP